MAGLPWVITFGLLALLGYDRGWMWLLLVAVFCMGIGAADTGIGGGLYGAVTGVLAGLWSAVVGVVGSVAS